VELVTEDNAYGHGYGHVEHDELAVAGICQIISNRETTIRGSTGVPYRTTTVPFHFLFLFPTKSTKDGRAHIGNGSTPRPRIEQQHDDDDDNDYDYSYDSYSFMQGLRYIA